MKKMVKKAKKIMPIIGKIILVLLIMGVLRTMFSDTIKDKLSNKDQEPYSYETGLTIQEESKSVSVEMENFDYYSIPDYVDQPYVFINDNIPFFDADEVTVSVFENYSELDEYGRCGVAFANICKELMPTEERESISSVYPSGWKFNGKNNNHEYEFVDGGYIYNRCHLIGFQLTGENANKENLITGTRYLNIEGMLPFENIVADYVKEEENSHVLYRVTPIFLDSELVCRGVLLEGYSVEDKGESISFCVYAYNVQPGLDIDYQTGENNIWLSDQGETVLAGFVVNNKTMQFHIASCKHAQVPSSYQVYVVKDREAIVNEGYSPCKTCNP